MRDASPLRYPGGKWRIVGFFQRLIQLNNLNRPQYVEPYAGGASLALSLLFQEQVSEIFLNDLDPAIFAFWDSVLTRNKDFIRLLLDTPVTYDEWIRQKAKYINRSATDKLELGFATFFLNRTNYSGILNGGVIGGKKQQGTWRIDARYNKLELKRRIEKVFEYKYRIHISCMDAMKFIQEHKFSKRKLVYLDPPYYGAGKRLYLNAYNPDDHATVSENILLLKSPWVVSYDDVPQIRRLYKTVKSRRIKLLHTAQSSRNGDEILFFSPKLRIPLITG